MTDEAKQTNETHELTRQQLEGFIFSGDRVIVGLKDGKAVSVMALTAVKESPETIKGFLEQALELVNNQAAVLRAAAFNKEIEAEKAKVKQKQEAANGEDRSAVVGGEGSQV